MVLDRSVRLKAGSAPSAPTMSFTTSSCQTRQHQQVVELEF
jgi:hypothetical protein